MGRPAHPMPIASVIGGKLVCRRLRTELRCHTQITVAIVTPVAMFAVAVEPSAPQWTVNIASTTLALLRVRHFVNFTKNDALKSAYAPAFTCAVDGEGSTAQGTCM